MGFFKLTQLLSILAYCNTPNSGTHIMHEEILNQWSGSNFCDLHLAISIWHTEMKQIKSKTTLTEQWMNSHPRTTCDRSGSSSLVQYEVWFLFLVSSFIRRSVCQFRGSFSKSLIQDLHALRRIALCVTLNHSDFCPTSSLSVSDVLGQHHALRSRGMTQRGYTIQKSQTSHCNHMIRFCRNVIHIVHLSCH